jgi:hypothetical protein
MATATLNGKTVTACRVQIPASGVWFADVEIDRAEQLTGSVTLVLADLTLKGTILSGGPWQSRARYRIAGGAGGWGKVIPAKAYANDLGVKLTNAIGDAARACGETVGAIPVGTTGPNFVRARGPGVARPERARGRREDGGARLVRRRGRGHAVRSAAQRHVLGRGHARRSRPRAEPVELAATSIAALLPGVVVDGIEAVDVEHVLDDKLRTTIWGKGPANTSRLTAAFDRIVDERTAHTATSRPGSTAWSCARANGSSSRRRASRAGCRTCGTSACATACPAARARRSSAPWCWSRSSTAILAARRDRVRRPGVARVHRRRHLPRSRRDGQRADRARDVRRGVGAVRVRGAARDGGGRADHRSGRADVRVGGDRGGTVVDLGRTLDAIDAAGAIPPLGTTKAALLSALAAKTADTAGDSPSIGWPKVMGG